MGGAQTFATKIGPKIRFFCHFFKFSCLFSHLIPQSDSLEQFLTTSRGKTHEKNFGRPNFCQTGQNWVRN